MLWRDVNLQLEQREEQLFNCALCAEPIFEGQWMYKLDAPYCERCVESALGRAGFEKRKLVSNVKGNEICERGQSLCIESAG